jgi:hypothetical protein
MLSNKAIGNPEIGYGYADYPPLDYLYDEVLIRRLADGMTF